MPIIDPSFVVLRVIIIVIHYQRNIRSPFTSSSSSQRYNHRVYRRQEEGMNISIQSPDMSFKKVITEYYTTYYDHHHHHPSVDLWNSRTSTLVYSRAQLLASYMI